MPETTPSRGLPEPLRPGQAVPPAAGDRRSAARRRGALRRTPALLVALLLVLVANACATVPPAEPPELPVEVPAEWTGPDALTSPLPPDGDWWRTLGDGRLEPLVAEALARNADLAAAAARVEAAAAQARIAGADQWPQANGRFDASRRRQNFLGFPIPGAGQQVLSTTTTSLQAGLNLSWELDLWGRLRAAEGAAVARAQASYADLWGVRLSLAGQTAKAWFAALEAAEQVALAEETVENHRLTEERIRRRYELGLRPPLELRLAITNRAAAQAQLAQRRRQLDAALRRLELLLGRYPDGDLATGAPPPLPPELAEALGEPVATPDRPLPGLYTSAAVEPVELPPLPEPWIARAPRLAPAASGTGTATAAPVLASLPDAPPAPVPAGLPAELLGRRPDLLAAERRAAAAGLSVDEAEAALLPRISLTGSAGRSSQELEDLLDNDFTVWSLAAGILQPIFQGGRLRAAVDLAEAREREALASFVSAALGAFSDVEQALAAERFLDEQVTALAEAAREAVAARDLAQQRYDAGLQDYLTVLESQRQALNTRAQLIAARRERLEARVDLHLALGGGFTPAPAETTAGTLAPLPGSDTADPDPPSEADIPNSTESGR